MDNLKKHYPAPDCYPDKRGLVLTMCGKRVDEKKEIEYQNEPSCVVCSEGKEDYNNLQLD